MTDLTEEQRRETLIDTWASWALDGYLPSAADRRLAALYISGEMTIDEVLEETKRRFSQPDPGPHA